MPDAVGFGVGARKPHFLTGQSPIGALAHQGVYDVKEQPRSVKMEKRGKVWYRTTVTVHEETVLMWNSLVNDYGYTNFSEFIRDAVFRAYCAANRDADSSQ